MTDLELNYLAKVLNIQHFRGVFMIDKLPKYPNKHESAIVNLEPSSELGSHWVCYVKQNNFVKYFDSFGNLKPPPQLLEYFKGLKITYNRERYQKWNTSVCGHLCLQYLVDASHNV